MKLTISALGDQGDGISHAEGKTAFVSGALPGETVEAAGTPPYLSVASIDVTSPHRVDSICSHFGVCGGCAVQHLSPAEQLRWKRDKVVSALQKNGVNAKVDDCMPCPDQSRRRVTFSVRRGSDSVELGFKRRSSDELVDLNECPILMPEISGELEALRKISASILRGNEEIQVLVTAADNGLDLSFSLPGLPSDAMLADFVRAFAKTSFLRASANGELLVEKTRPVVHFGEAVVDLPTVSFLQSVSAIEEQMSARVCDHLKKSKKVVDLFCGAGTFALRLAARSSVHGVEAEEPALRALAAARLAPGSKRITTEQRDLFETPLLARELNAYTGICLDPPRAGAAAQVAEIAKSDVGRLAYVSCNPTTLAKDLGTLANAGFNLDSVTPFDQFAHSPHVEVVALLSRKADRRRQSIFSRKV